MTISTADISQSDLPNVSANINVDFWPGPAEPRRGLHQNGRANRRLRVRRYVDGDGVQDAGEPGIAGASSVDAERHNGQRDGGYSFDDDRRDASGLYLFNNLIPGNYTVTFTTPAGYTVTYQNQGADDNIGQRYQSSDGPNGQYQRRFRAKSS